MEKIKLLMKGDISAITGPKFFVIDETQLQIYFNIFVDPDNDSVEIEGIMDPFVMK